MLMETAVSKARSPDRVGSRPAEPSIAKLRPLEPGDIDSLIRWVNDAAVTLYLSQAVAYPTSGSDGFRWLEELSRSHTDRVFAIETLEGRLIGSVGLHAIRWIDRKAELAVMIGERDCWNRGYGTWAVREMLRRGIEEMSLQRIYLRVASNHQAAIRVYRRCGFQSEGLLRRDRYVGRGYGDTLIMSVLMKEFAAGESRARVT
jgi:RimJ/RimL family protein N-acetyltransferase